MKFRANENVWYQHKLWTIMSIDTDTNMANIALIDAEEVQKVSLDKLSHAYLALTEKQKTAVENLKNALNACRAEGVSLYFDYYTNSLMALNGNAEEHVLSDDNYANENWIERDIEEVNGTYIGEELFRLYDSSYEEDRKILFDAD